MTEWAEIDELPDLEQPPRLTEADFQGCRYIAEEPTPIRQGMFWCRPVPAGESWCSRHRRVVWQRAASKRVAA
jgi:hypothetical protein